MGIKIVEQMMGMCAELVADAAGLVEPHDQAAVEAFAERLCGLEGLGRDELRERLRGIEIPGDFRHLRLYNLSNGMPWGGRYSMRQELLTLDELIIIMCCVIDRNDVTLQGPGVWSETIALPSGTLECWNWDSGSGRCNDRRAGSSRIDRSQQAGSVHRHRWPGHH